MDNFILIIISGMAVGYTVELLSSLLSAVVSARIVKLIFTLPFSYGATWLLGFQGLLLVVAGPASAFFCLASLLILNRPATVQTMTTRRY